jgi:hypothetical protein
MTAQAALTEIHDVAAGRKDRDVCALSCLTKIEELARQAGDLGPAILRAARSSHDATACMAAVAAVCALANHRGVIGSLTNAQLREIAAMDPGPAVEIGAA